LVGVALNNPRPHAPELLGSGGGAGLGGHGVQLSSEASTITFGVPKSSRSDLTQPGRVRSPIRAEPEAFVKRASPRE
jgi:hypothetical protein